MKKAEIFARMEPQECPICRKTCKNYKSLSVHMRQHIDPREIYMKYTIKDLKKEFNTDAQCVKFVFENRSGKELTKEELTRKEKRGGWNRGLRGINKGINLVYVKYDGNCKLPIPKTKENK